MSAAAFAAVDLGASSGRVMLGRVGPDTLELTEVNRFRNGAIRLPDGMYWDVLGLYQDIVTGLRGAVRQDRRAGRSGASTPGASTTACSTRTARCAATRTPTATRAARRRSRGARKDRPGAAVRASPGCSSSRSTRSTSSPPNPTCCTRAGCC